MAERSSGHAESFVRRAEIVIRIAERSNGHSESVVHRAERSNCILSGVVCWLETNKGKGAYYHILPCLSKINLINSESVSISFCCSSVYVS